LHEGAAPSTAPPSGRVPRLARLMALALRCEELIRSGQVKNLAELARLGHVSGARISQIMSLLQLAPDLQEELLFRSRPARGRDPRALATVAADHLGALRARTAAALAAM
jgi:hypothetical protein